MDQPAKPAFAATTGWADEFRPADLVFRVAAGEIRETPAMRAARQCAAFEAKAIEETLARWISKSGLTPAELAQVVGYSVERSWPQEDLAEPFTETLLRFAVTITPHWLGGGEKPAWFAQLR